MSGRPTRIDEVILNDYNDFVIPNNNIRCGLTIPKKIEAIEIGQKHWEGPVNIANIDLRKLAERVETLEPLAERVETLESLVKRQSELINAMWYHPGMPGADEIEEKFRANLEKLSLAKQ